MIRPLKRLASAIYQHLDTPTSLACYMLMKYGEWDQLATKQADPSNYRDTYHSAVQYAKDSQACDLLRKYELLPTSIDKEEAALASFDSSEMQCFDTNYRLTHLLTGYTPASEALRSILLKASKWISRVLGPLPDRPFRGRFGPGTAFEFRGTAFEPCTLTKCWIAPALTPQAREIFWLATKGFGLWERRRRLGLPCYRPVNQNRFTTVPKDGKTHRGICIEPGGNLWLQLGVGRYLKERLSQMGLYLRPREELSTSPSDFRIVRHDPQAEDIHCELARMGSCTNALATIDLSSASDTVSYELVRADRKSVV